MRSLDKQGFDIFPEVFDAETVSSINRSLEESMIPRSRAGMRGAFQIAGVRSLAIDERLMRVAREVLGENALPFRATLFDKSPRSNWLVVWHQDTALPLVER